MKISKRFIKYFIIGGVTFLVDFFLSIVFFYIVGLGSVLSNTLSVFFASSLKFFINKIFTFKNKSKHIKSQFFASFLVLGIYLIFTNSLVYLFFDVFSIDFVITKIIVVFLGVVVNYFLDKKITFNKIFD